MTAERRVSALFDKIPKNQNFPDDIFLMKEMKDKENRIHYAPSIILHEGDKTGLGEKDLEDILLFRNMPVSNEYMIDVVVRNNSYMPVSGRIIHAYYTLQENVAEVQSWRPLKTLSGQYQTETSMVFPCQDSFTRESFIVTVDSNKPYYLIVSLDEEFSATKLPDEPVDLNQLNESYYWCILDSEELMG